MNILFFANFAGSPRYGMVYGHYYLAKEWVAMGHQVTIVSASYAHTRFLQPDPTSEISTEDIDGVRFIWLPTPAYDPKSGIGRAKNILSFSLKCRFAKLPIEYADLVICSSHHPFPIYAARHYARKSNARLVFEVRDLWPLSLIELGEISRKNPFIYAMQKAEDYAYKHADCVISVLPGAKTYMVSRGMSPEKFIYIPNGADLQEQTNQIPLPPYHTNRLVRLREEGKFIIGYAGKIGLSNALHTLVDAIGMCKDKQIVAVLLGSGAYAGELKNQANALNIADRVIFLESVGKNQVADFLARIDAAYIGLERKSIFRFGVSPTKLNDFMLSAKPVIYAIDAPENIIGESGAGISCPPESPDELAKAMQIMKSMTSEERDEMGRKGKAWIIQNRDYRVLARQFLDSVMSGSEKNDRL